MTRIAAVDASVRLPDKTSERTSVRCNSFPLIVKSPNLRLRNCRKGSLDISTLQKPDISTLQLHGFTVHKMRYQTSIQSRPCTDRLTVEMAPAASQLIPGPTRSL